MPSTDSGLPEKMDAMPPEQVVGMTRNGWSASIGFAGRHGPDYAVGYPRKPRHFEALGFLRKMN
jgi:hypothetical protein